MAQLGFLALAFGGVPVAMLVWQVRLISPAGIPALAIAWYMLGVGSVFAVGDLLGCLNGFQDEVIRLDNAGRSIVETQACWSDVEVFFLAAGLGMISAGLLVVAALFADRSPVTRRFLLVGAGLLSVSGIGYAFSPVGLVVAAISPLSLLAIAGIGPNLRPWHQGVNER